MTIKINRIFLTVLDSAGVGAMPDAFKYGDEGANTLGHIYNDMGGDFSLPNLESLGLKKILKIDDKTRTFCGSFAKMAEVSFAKDTTAGHWEIAGLILKKPFAVYPEGFPKNLILEFEEKADVRIIGNCVASGIEIINRLGDKHIKSGCPIVYTSADSVFQIAAHEEKFGLENLYRICQIAREMLVGKHNVGRVIARPFIGSNGNFVRTANRKDYSLSPFENTVLDNLKADGGDVIAIGKIEDIFNFKGITKSIHSKNNAEGMRALLSEVKNQNKKKTLIFANLVDFDMLYGHRRNIKGYADALKTFDDFLLEFIPKLKSDDILIITADHGCDPSFTSHTDHTREYVPLLLYGKNIKQNINLGIRETFADIAQTISDIFDLPKMKNGKSFRDLIIDSEK